MIKDISSHQSKITFGSRPLQTNKSEHVSKIQFGARTEANVSLLGAVRLMLNYINANNHVGSQFKDNLSKAVYEFYPELKTIRAYPGNS